MIIDCKCRKEKDTFIIEFDEVQTFRSGEYVQIKYIFDIVGILAAIAERSDS